MDTLDTTHRPLFRASLLVLGVIALVSIGYFIYHTRMSERVVMKEARPFAAQGTIYLTLTPKNANYTGIFSFDVGTNQLAKVVGKDNTGSITAHPMDGSTLLIASNISLDTVKTNISPLQIFSANDQGVLKQLTNTPTAFKRHPSYSSALDLYVYAAKSGATTLGSNPNDFNIYTFKDDVEKLITNGALPTLTPDGKSVVALRKDGLYLINLLDESAQKIWNLDHGGSALNLQFTISPTGKYIAWSIPNDGYIYIMTVSSWAPFSGAVTKKIETHAFWPVFSPNEEYLAYEQVDWGPKPTNQKLVVFDLVTPQGRVVQDLTQYDQSTLFVTAWK